MPRVQSLIAAVAFITCAVVSDIGQAQGLMFFLPEDGTGVEYEGEIVQETIRDDIKVGKETVTKARMISIKSVGREDREFEGTLQPWRWIEIKVVTGDAGEAGINPGPVGSRIYKVLVPESKIIEAAEDATGVPNVMFPIVEGYRRSGEAEVRPIKSHAISIYPTICQLTNYPEQNVVSASATPSTKMANASFSAKHIKGKQVMERRESRTTNEADFWVTKEVPFGLARWEVVVTQEKKESTANRQDFTEFSTTKSVMSVRRILDNVESELVTN